MTFERQGFRPRSRDAWLLVALGAGVVAIVAAVAVVLGADLSATLAPDEPAAPMLLERPRAGEVRADHLADGTPVWVIGHEDGTVGVLSGFDTHVPFGIGKLLWWCGDARALENPHHGSKWDAYGVRIGGPAPVGLPSWEVSVAGNRIELGARRAPPPEGTPPLGPPEQERQWCNDPASEVAIHTFDGWRLWDSPGAAIASGEAGWILIEGELLVEPQANRVLLCAAVHGCADAAIALGVVPPEPGGDPAFSPLGPGRFIAKVHDGALANLTRVIQREQE